MRKILLASAMAMAVSAMALPAHAGDKEFFGTGVGAALGGLLGSQFGHGDGRLAYTALGVFGGGLVGNSVGTSLDRADRAYVGGGRSYYYSGYAEPAVSYYGYQQTYVAPPAPPPARVVYVQPEPEVVEYRPMPTGVITQGYVGGDTGGRSSSSGYCREYTQQVRIGNRVQESYGTACLQPDGSWQMTQ